MNRLRTQAHRRERDRHDRPLLDALALAAVAAAALLFPAVAGAATITVTRTDDAPQGSFDDLGCTLRDAIRAANDNVDESASLGCRGDNAGADTIVLQGGKTYVLSSHGVDDTNATGDLDVVGPVTIRSSGPGLARIDAASNTLPGQPVGADRALHVLASAGQVTLEGVRVEGGFVGNFTAGYAGGGGILAESLLTLRGSEVINNRVEGSGYLVGGGIWARGSTARLRIFASTIADNTVVQQGNGATGAGIGAYPDVTELTVENSTISGNQAQGGFSARAAGIFGGDYLNSPVSTLSHVTVTGNSGSSIGAVWLRGSITGSLIAGNTLTEGVGPDCYQAGAIVSGGGNLIGNAGEGAYCGLDGPGDAFGTTSSPIVPNLGALVDNGGPTRTRVPNPGSPAIDRGGPCPATDQRGFFRFAAAPCDAGAVEVGASPTPPSPPTAPQPPSPTPAPPAAAPPTGKRAAALARCGKLKKATKKRTRKARTRCRAKARKLPL